MEKLQDLVDGVRLESEKLGLLLNANKTKVKKIRRKTTKENDINIKINNESIENVKQMVFTDNYDYCVEIKKGWQLREMPQ